MIAATKRILPADVYDTLEFSALAYGGVGAASWAHSSDGAFRFGEEPDAIPNCISGHARAADPMGYLRWMLPQMELGIGTSDLAVIAINKRNGAASPDAQFARVPFDLWCAELGVERGT